MSNGLLAFSAIVSIFKKSEAHAFLFLAALFTFLSTVRQQLGLQISLTDVPTHKVLK